MAITAGEIKINMRIEDKDVTLTVMNVDRLLGKLQQSFDKTGRAVQGVDRHFSSFFTRFRHMVQMFAAARFALMDFNDAVLSLPASVIRASMEFERITVLMSGLSKETDEFARKAEGMKNVEFAFDLAKNAPFQVKAITDAMVKMKSAGIDPTNIAMKALANGVAQFGGTSDTMHRASIAIQQMAGKGVISMEELRQQLGEAVPTAMMQMADAAGISLAELVDKISKGVVESKTALNLLFAEMQSQAGGAAKRMMDTMVGMLARLKTEWDLFQKDIGDAGFLDAAKDVIREVTNLLQSEEGREFARSIGKSFADLVRVLISVTHGIRESWDAIKGFGAAIAGIFVAGKVTSWLAAAASGFGNFTSALSNWRGHVIANHAQIQATYQQHQRVHMEMMNNILHNTQRLQSIESMINLARANGMRGFSAGYIAHLELTAAALRKSIAQQEIYLASAQRWTAFATGFGRMVGFITGPIGQIAIALGLGALAWNAWGDSAEEAFAKARQAALDGNTTKETVMNMAREVDGLREKLDSKTRELASGVMSPEGLGGAAVPMSPAHRKKLIGEIEQTTRELKGAMEAQMRTMRDQTRQGHDQAIRNFNREAEELATVRAARANREIFDLKKQSEDKARTNAAYAKEVGEKLKAIRQSEYQDNADHFARLEASYRAASKKDGDLQSRLADEAARLKKQNLQKIAASQAGLAFVVKDDKNTGKGSNQMNPFQRLLAKTEADLAALETINRHLLKQEQHIETEASIRARVKARIKEQLDNDEFTMKNSKGAVLYSPSPAAIQALEDAQTRVAILDRQNKILDDLIPKIRKLAEAEEDSFRVLREGSDEGTTSGMTALRNSFIGLDAQIGKTGQTLEVFNRVKNEAFQLQGVTDLNTFVGGFAEKTREINISLLSTDRERQEAQYQREVNEARRRFNVRVEVLRELFKEDEKFLAKTTEARERHNAYIEALEKQHMKNMESPMQKLATEWEDVTGQLKSASTSWANQTVDAIVNMVKTGKLEFSKLVESILADILRIQLQKRMAEPLSKLIDTGINVLGGVIGGGGPANSSNLGFMPPMKNGGIGTQFGEVSLKRYAEGGVAKARNPQLAIFGEGSMNEAYVPLPDGRSIPVTIKDGGMPSVQVNIINQTGTKINQEQSQPRFDGRQMVLDIVLSGASTPGPFRDGIKSALG